MSAVPYRKVDRHHIFKEIVKMIERTKENEVEISSSDLADKFNVQAPTMDYHLSKLIDEGYLTLSPKRGRYNRKIYRLPATSKAEPTVEHTETPKSKTEVVTPESAEKFKRFLQEHANKAKAKQEVQEELPLENTPPSKKLEVVPAAPVAETKKEEIKKEPIQPPEPLQPQEDLEVTELTLDDRISIFMEQAKRVHSADVLLQHEDREILSVMNETIHSTNIYLKDLSEQLSTINNKQLIQGLIDDRNRIHQQMERLEKDLEIARANSVKTIEKYEVDPTRVRFMHQLIISTVDDYVNRTNQGMALARTEFRNKITKELSDLVKYALRIER